MWEKYFKAANIEEALQLLSSQREKARIIAGATDLMLEFERGARKGVQTLLDVSKIPNLDEIVLDEKDQIHLRPLVTHNQCVASKLIRERALPLAQACFQVGSPQIRNRATIAGNLVTASPSNDTITPLMALDATVVLQSLRGKRELPLSEFYTGVRKTKLEPDEMLVDIHFPALGNHVHGWYVKFALRRAQAISVVNSAVVVEETSGIVNLASITLGAVAPTIIHAKKAEDYLLEKELSEEVIGQAARIASSEASPISDVRGSAEFRKEITRVIVGRALKAIAGKQENTGVPDYPVLLRSKHRVVISARNHNNHEAETIRTTINGKKYEIANARNKSLLRMLREDVGLIGTKEGCAEGECGACTVHLDGQAVMSCMVPAPCAEEAEIVTVEGLAEQGSLHPLQQSFIEASAVQCGYCTPGFIMSGAMLLEEKANPSIEDIRNALTGNLCRCTGYYTIIQAVEKAASEMSIING